ncbi:MAG: DGQHR domain-containing protein [Arcobacter sp.]|jgi:DNA phosphorothioation-associated DGQHR protein 1|uniref:DGQHR domain-containing protein n=1 Tax=Arcobacter sp. TaxID=1872629 RepID=UPI002A75DBB2|nr:DGQHR domain-containing protein [Arcobacter sp.]MDY3205037.1 DGQHR domain-containing protein [Arcobacter sp.]
MIFPIKIPAIRVEQPLGVFYVVTISAETLLKICYTVETRILEDGNTEFIKKESNTFKSVLNKITGTQRQIKPDRLKEIKEYSETVNASFPNSIILGANFDEDGNLVENLEEKWIVRKKENSDCYTLIIPSEKKLASIIDGQHRVFAFEKSKNKDMQLLCSVYLDLPLPYHAQMFTTINMNQRSVDKNLTYNLFQFEIDEGNTKSWSPETLAVYLARLLNETDTPLKNKLKIGVEVINEDDKLNIMASEQTTISMAAIIDGILSLISTKPKSDRLELHKYTLEEGRTRDKITRNDLSPLRELYINNRDRELYDFILNFILSIHKNLWVFKNATIFTTTLGMQALFDFLKITLTQQKYIELNFNNLLAKTQSINFDDEYFGIQSKARTRLKNILLFICNVQKIESIKIYSEEEKNKFDNFLKKYGMTS